MSYGLKYTIPFASLHGRKYRVEIEEDGYSGEVTELTGAPSAFTISIADDAFIYTPLRLSTGTISVVGEAELRQLFATGWQQYRVTLVEIDAQDNTSVAWCGFVRPEEYTQDYSGGTQPLDIEVQSAVNVLEQIPYKVAAQDGKPGFVSLRSLIGRALTLAAGRYSRVYVPHTFAIDHDHYGENALLREDCQISEQNFFDEESKPMNWLQVLEEISRFAHVTLCDWRGDIWFVDYDYKDAYDAYSIGMSLVEANAVTPSYRSVQAIGYHGNQHTLDLLGGYNKATIKVSNYSAASNNTSQVILPNDDMGSLPVFKSWETDAEWTRTEGEWENRIYHLYRRRCATKWLNGVNWKTLQYMPTGYSVDGEQISRMNVEAHHGQTIRERVEETTLENVAAAYGHPIGVNDGYLWALPTGPNGVIYGAFFVRVASIEYVSEGTNTKVANTGDVNQDYKVVYPDDRLKDSTWNWKNYLIIRSVGNGRGTYRPDWSWASFGVRMEDKHLLEFANATPEASYPNGWVKIEVKSATDFVDAWSVRKGTTADLYCILRIGEKYWNGTSWQAAGCGFSIEIDENGDAKQKATPEQIAALGTVDCFAVPILEQLQGSVEFVIVGASQNIALQTLKLSYDIMDNGSVTADENGDRIYTNEVNADFINELDEIEAKISSYNNDGACFSKVMLNGKYIEAHLYEGVTHRYVRPEEMLLRRIVSQYEVPKVRLSQELRQTPELLPADIITDKTQPGARFVQTGGEIDFANDTATVQMITFEE
jgi:hypothetical protein